MKGTVEVLNPGLFSTVQDGGRFGFMEYGVPVSGSMDSYAAGLANLLVNNQADAAVLEITLVGPKLKFSKTTTIAITGAGLQPMINGRAINNNQAIPIHAGEELHFGKRKYGYRAYLAVLGGFLSEQALHSRSWYDGITSFNRLEKGMKLSYGKGSEEISPSHVGVKSGAYLNAVEVEAFPGPEFELLSPEERALILKSFFHIGKNSNRMGIQLDGVFKNALDPILTGPVVPGTVQLTPSGTLIILMRDGQTTGGYPRVLQLTERGINTVAQKIVGEKLQFKLKKYGVPS